MAWAPTVETMPMHPRTVALAATLAAFAAGCTGTQATDLWRDPSRQVPFKKILVGVAGVDATARRSAEDAIVGRLPPGTGVPSYRVVPAGRERDVEAVREIVAKEGFDGVLVARLQGVEQELTRTTMATPVTVYGGYGYAYTSMYATQAVDIRKLVRIESKLFDVASENPVWTMVSETVDPTSRGQVTDEVATLIVAKLQEGGLLVKR
jgi:hypothetical protein